MVRLGSLLRALSLLLALCAALVACGGSGSRSGESAGPSTSVDTVYPVSIEIPKIDAHSNLTMTGLNADGTIEVPDVAHPQQASWYRFAPPPGSPGPAIVLGHVNGGGHPGVFARLTELKVGDIIVINTSDGVARTFDVYKIQTVDKARFPWGEVAAEVPDPELRLVTCTGALDRKAHSYLSNLIVYAKVELG